MESVWQHGGSIRVKISKFIPWDFRFTGFGVMMVVFPIHTLIAYYFLYLHGPQGPYVAYAIVMTLFTALIVWEARSDGPPLWTFFIGTKVVFKDPVRLEKAFYLVDENGWKWNRDVANHTVIDSKQMTMLFRRRDHALLTKLAA